jgi:hypothetical protein
MRSRPSRGKQWLFLALAVLQQCAAIDFTAHTITTLSPDAVCVFAIDVDRDGDIDVLSATWADVDMYENDGSQGFTKHTIETVCCEDTKATSVFAIDLDGDLDIDFLSSFYYGMIAWYENDGSQVWLCVCVYVCVCVCVCMCVYVCVYVYVCMYVHGCCVCCE